MTVKPGFLLVFGFLAMCWGAAIKDGPLKAAGLTLAAIGYAFRNDPKV